MRIKKGFVLRKVGDDYIAVATGKASKDFHGMIKLNKTGMEIWTLLEKDNDIPSITKALAEEYGMDEKEIQPDVESIIKVLQEKHFLES